MAIPKSMQGGDRDGHGRGKMYTAGKLAEALGVSQGKVKKLIAALQVEPDEVKRNCKYYGSETLERLKVALAQE